VRAVSLPAFSELRSDPPRYKASFGRALGMLFVPVVPACVLLGVLGGPLVRFVYGTRWSEAAGPLALLAVLGASRVALELAYDFLVSAGESGEALRLNLLWFVTLIPTLIVAAHLGGITGVAAGHLVALLLVVLPAFLRALSRLGVTLPSILGPIARPLQGGALMALVALAALVAMPTDIARILVGGVASVLVYGLVVGLPLLRQHRRGELFAVRSAPEPELVESVA
jgi:PST family polysaccharide transporter